MLFLCNHCASHVRFKEYICTDCLQALPWNQGVCGACGLPVGPLNAHTCQASAALSRIIVPFQYRYPISNWLKAFKFYAKLEWRYFFADVLSQYVLPDHYDVIIPIPLHKKRMQQRGYNQSYELAKLIARAVNITVRHNVLQRTRYNTPQAQCDKYARYTNMSDMFSCSHAVHNQRILLVDDVVTTGSTLTEAAFVLKKHGARLVHALVVARST